MAAGVAVAGAVGARRISTRSRAPRPKVKGSPYYGIPENDWERVTRELIAEHPLTPEEIVDVVRQSWDTIFRSTLGDGFRIGQHIFPKPQVMGFFLHELIPLEFEHRHKGVWRAEKTAADKDLVYAPDNRFSVEIKTSSHPQRIFANRSYGQEGESDWKKSKSGYYIAANFDPWPEIDEKPAKKLIQPALRLIRFGWLDHTDWVAQSAATGQQSSLPALIENRQLLTFYSG